MRYRILGGFLGVLVALGAIFALSAIERARSANGVVPVTVTATLDDRPAEGALVVLIPEDPNGTPAFGVVGKKGVAKPSSIVRGDGAKPGKYFVAIERVATEENPAPEKERRVPDLDALRKTPGFVVEVVAGRKNDFVFEIGDQTQTTLGSGSSFDNSLLGTRVND